MTTINDIKLPPYDLQMEKAVLGLMSFDIQRTVEIIDSLDVNELYIPIHRQIYTAIENVYRKHHNIDVHLICKEIKSINPEIEIEYFLRCQTCFAVMHTAKHYIKVIKDCAVKRHIIEMAENYKELAYDNKMESDELIVKIEKDIFSINKHDSAEGFVNNYQVAKSIYNQIDHYKETGIKPPCIETGIRYLDLIINGGLRGGQVMVLAGSTSSGKTAMALNITRHIAKHYGKVAYYSYEMKPDELMYRMLSNELSITQDDLRAFELSDYDMKNMSDVLDTWATGNIIFDKSKADTVAKIHNKCRRLKMENNLQLIVIDYIAQIRNGGGDERARITKISNEIKQMAMDLNIPVLALSQLNRENNKRSPRRPAMYDLKESSAIEQDADIVSLLYRPGFWGVDEVQNAGFDPNTEMDITEFTVAKHRQGKLGIFYMTFNGEYNRFTPYSRNKGAK